MGHSFKNRVSARPFRTLLLFFLVVSVLSLAAHAKLGQYERASSRQSIYVKNIKISTDRQKPVSTESISPLLSRPGLADLAVLLPGPEPQAASLDEATPSPFSGALAPNLWRRPPPSY
ncbi:MAG TPA: hypothetical protein VEG30_08780 [Terriglobales bacterium]|nr:hypothetical protein [Terriglobales bacterium]